MIRIWFGGILFLTIIIRSPKNSIGNYLGAPSQIDLVGLMALGFRRDDLGF